MDGFTNILLQQYTTQLDEQGQDFARRISQAAARMDHLIRDLLDYGRLSHTKLTFSRISLETQVVQVLGSIHEELQRKQAVVDVEQPLGTVWGNGYGAGPNPNKPDFQWDQIHSARSGSATEDFRRTTNGIRAVKNPG